MSLPLPRSVLPRPALTTYFLLAFGISWIGVLAVVGPGGFPGTEEEFRRLIVPVVIAMLLGPSIAGIVATALSRGRAGLRDLLERGKAWHVAPRWYAVALLTAPVVIVATLGILALISPIYRPGLATTPTPVMHLVLGLLTGAAAGFFEEIGWTGFAIPAMRKRLSPTQTGFLLGIAWGAWHALVSWWGSTGAGDVPMAIYLAIVLFAFLVPYRILMVWVYERTGSLFIAMLMHAALTASVRIFDPIGIAGRDLTLYNAAMGGAIWVVVGTVALVSTLRPRRSGTPASTPLRARPIA